MELQTSLAAFVLAVVLIAASPGPAMALIFRRAVMRGLRGAVPTVLGPELGLYCWALFAGAGLAALVAASEVAFVALRVVGAAVLLYLGLEAWRTAWRARTEHGEATAVAEGPVGRRRWWAPFGEGVLVQLANPKAAVFMIAFYPQFVPSHGPVLATTAVLAPLQVTLETLLYLALAAGVARGRSLVPPSADPAPAGRGQRDGAGRAGVAGRRREPLTTCAARGPARSAGFRTTPAAAEALGRLGNASP